MPVSERRLLIFAALIRLIPAIFIYGTEDVSAWHRCARIMSSGGNPYDTPQLISWPPLWPALAWISLHTADMTGLPFSFVVKLFPIAADLALTVVLLRAASEFALPRYFTAAAFAFNPVAIYTSAIHGNFDSIPALFLTLAIVFATREAADGSGVRTGFWLGIGAAFKTWPLLALPGVIASSAPRRRQLMVCLIAVGIFAAALLLPWPLIGSAAIASILRYRGFFGWWGITSIEFLSGHALPDMARTLLFYGAMGGTALLLLVKRTPPALGALLLLETFYLVTPGFGLQYLLWIVPVALIADQKRALAYSALAGALILFELMVRPYTGHLFESLRFLPHSDFARNYGHAVEHRYTAAGRLILWLYFGYWWISTTVRVVTSKTERRVT